MALVKEYQINVVGKTANDADLPNPHFLGVIRTKRDGDKYRVVIVTCTTSQGKATEHSDQLPIGGTCEYTYAPATDNSKSESLMLTNNFEANLDTWYGAGNWVAV